MKSRIIIHATNTLSDMQFTLDDIIELNTMNDAQSSTLRMLLNNLTTRHPTATTTDANALLHHTEYPTKLPHPNAPYFDVPQWLTAHIQLTPILEV